MIDEKVLAQINGAYVCPADAGPAWREAFGAGVDMSLLECSLAMTPEQRLLENDRALALVRMLENALVDGSTK